MRYRVHFVVRFEREIEASNDVEARAHAQFLLETEPVPEGGTIHWNTMDLIGDDD